MTSNDAKRWAATAHGTTATIDRKQARKIAQDKSAAGWLIAADALEDQGDDAEAARCRQVGEFIGRFLETFTPFRNCTWASFGNERLTMDVNGTTYSVRLRKRYGNGRVQIRVFRRGWNAMYSRELWIRTMGARYIGVAGCADEQAIYEKARDVAALLGLNADLPK